MSKIGKQPLAIPESVELTYTDKKVLVKGPKGELQLDVANQINVVIADGQVKITRKSDEPKIRALHGLTRSLVANALEGVTHGFTKRLELKGVGYRAEIQGNELVLNVGYSHPVKVVLPKSLEVKVEKNQIVIQGIDRQKVGQFGATVRAIRPPEPYKGKGIRYVDEIIKLKPGKQVAKATL